jgi:hypothetical protein
MMSYRPYLKIPQIGAKMSSANDHLRRWYPHLVKTLDDEGERFVVDVHRNQIIYLEDPAPIILQR